MTTSAVPGVSSGVGGGAPPAPLFREITPDSLWARAAFTPTYDPFDILTSMYEVPTKAATVVPFRPFVTQQHMGANMGLRNAILKPRQVGSTTFFLGIGHACAWTTPNLNMLVISHLEATTARIRETCKNWVLWLNEHHGAGIVIGRDNANELEFPEMNSRIFFGTSGTKGVGRSSTIHLALLTEVAYWEGSEYGGIIESMPDNGVVFAESTPNGASGQFYSLYHEENSYVKHFYPWFMEPSRAIDIGDMELIYNEDESLLVARHVLTKHQIAWRRWKIADMKASGSRTPFTQEYPEDDISCFTAGVKSAVPPRLLVQLTEQARTNPPVRTAEIAGDAWDPGGLLQIWIQPQGGHHYMVTCDVGGGHQDGDKSVAVVRDMDAGKRHVATLRGWWTPTKFADLTVDLARYYNEAYLSHERNGLGQEAVKQAAERIAYRNYHWDDKAKADGEIRAGFYVMPGQRTPLLTAVVQEAVSHELLSYDVELIEQLAAARLERGRQSTGWADNIVVPKTMHDDTLMAYAQGTAIGRTLVIVRNRPMPVQAL